MIKPFMRLTPVLCLWKLPTVTTARVAARLWRVYDNEGFEGVSHDPGIAYYIWQRSRNVGNPHGSQQWPPRVFYVPKYDGRLLVQVDHSRDGL